MIMSLCSCAPNSTFTLFNNICILVFVPPRSVCTFLSTFNMMKSIWPGLCVCVCDISYVASWLTCDQKRVTHPRESFTRPLKGGSSHSGCASPTQTPTRLSFPQCFRRFPFQIYCFECEKAMVTPDEWSITEGLTHRARARRRTGCINTTKQTWEVNVGERHGTKPSEHT